MAKEIKGNGMYQGKHFIGMWNPRAMKPDQLVKEITTAVSKATGVPVKQNEQPAPPTAADDAGEAEPAKEPPKE